MLSKKVKSRFFLFLILMILLTLLIFFIFKSLEKNIVYFLSPTEIYNQTNISLEVTALGTTLSRHLPGCM